MWYLQKGMQYTHNLSIYTLYQQNSTNGLIMYLRLLSQVDIGTGDAIIHAQQLIPPSNIRPSMLFAIHG